MSLDLKSNKHQNNIKEDKSNDKRIYEFEDFCLDAAHLMLSRGGREISLTPKVVETLLALVERHGEIVSKDELMQRLWANSFVEETNLVQNIHILRKNLGETHGGKPMIETLRRRGYRFNGKIKENEKINGEIKEIKENEDEKHAVPAAETKPPVAENPPENHSAVVLANSNRRWIFAAVAVCVVAILVTLAWSRFFSNQRKTDAFISPVSNIAFKRLTPDIDARFLVISPDGKYLAYAQRENGKYTLQLKDIATGGTVQLLPPIDTGYAALHFSPDGAQLFYSTDRPNTPNATIFRLTLANGEQQAIADDDISPFDISPDGTRIAFISGNYDLTITGADGSGGKHVLSHRAESKWFVTWESQLSWSPDGTRIAVCGGYDENGRSNPELIEVSVGDGSERRIATPSNWRDIDDVSWLADESGLLVTARQTPGEPYQIWRVSYTDGTATRITNDNHDYSWMSLSADSRLLVAEQQLGHFNIWTAPFADTKKLNQLTFGDAANDGYYGVAFMPDGRIVYSSTRSGNVDLWMMNADGSNQKQLTVNMGTWNGRPRVTPDGRFIVFSSTRSGMPQIWRMDSDGGNPKQLTIGNEDVLRLSVAPDGNWIYYAPEGKASVWKVSLEGGAPILVSTEKSISPTASPDGKLIARIQNEPGALNPWRVDVTAANGESLKVFDFPTRRNLLDWTADSKALISMSDSAGNLWEHPLNGSPPRQLTSFSAGQTAYFAVSPDYKQAAFSRGDEFREAILITESGKQ